MALSQIAKKAILCLSFYPRGHSLEWEKFEKKMGSPEAAMAAYRELDETPLIYSHCFIHFDPVFYEEPLSLELSYEGRKLALDLLRQR